MPKIILQGHIEVANADLESVLAELPNHIDLTRQEPGCLVFNVQQLAGNANYFKVYEEFADEASFEAHQQRVRASRWAEVTANGKRSYQISEED